MLVNAPLVDQLNEPTEDRCPDENARANCVPASLTSGIRALDPSAQVDGDALKDAVYGQGYTGPTDPTKYVGYLKSQFHVTMTQTNSTDGHQLVRTIIAGLLAHEPMTGAIPSQWGTAPPDPLHPVGGTHEVLWCDYNAAGGMLTAMNPWPVNGTTAFYQTMPADWWAARIVFGRVFTLSGGHMAITIDEISNYFTEIDAQHWVCKSNGNTVQLGILAAYQSWPANGTLAGLTALGLPLTGPTYLDQTQYPGVCEQTFERGCLRYDPNRLVDRPEGAEGAVYLAHYPAAAPDPKAAHALAQIAQITAVLAH